MKENVRRLETTTIILKDTVKSVGVLSEKRYIITPFAWKWTPEYYYSRNLTPMCHLWPFFLKFVYCSVKRDGNCRFSSLVITLLMSKGEEGGQ